MLALLQDAGYAFTDDLAKADAAIINTCAFIESAKTEAIEKILETASYREENPELKIIVSGCLAQRYADDIRAELPEVDGIMGTGSYSEVVSVVEAVLAGDKPTRRGAISAPLYDTPRAVSTGPNWAYLRIAEGCDNRCAYCVIPSLRGKFRSRTKESILEEARLLAASGVKELIIVAQDITRYGIDLYGKVCLTELLKELCKLDFRWVRLHYLYPELIDDELIDEIASEDKIVKYLDIPIQHINDTILRRMNRRGTGEEIRALFKSCASVSPVWYCARRSSRVSPAKAKRNLKSCAIFSARRRSSAPACSPTPPRKERPPLSCPTDVRPRRRSAAPSSAWRSRRRSWTALPRRLSAGSLMCSLWAESRTARRGAAASTIPRTLTAA